MGSSSRAALRRRGSTTWPGAPASPRARMYLHFKDKESMFEELIRTAIVPLLNRLAMATPPAGDRLGAGHDGGVCRDLHS